LLLAQLAGCGEAGGPPLPEFPQEDTTFYVGPYIGHTGPDFVNIGWETLEEGDSRVEWGESSNYGKVTEGPRGTMHQVKITGLRPGRRYHYRACTKGICSRELFFDTAPLPGTPFLFGVYADCQDNPDIHRQVVDILIENRAWMALVAGDTVSDGSVREQYKERYFDPARRFSQVRPRYPTVGNHDRKDVEVVAFRDYNILPEDPAVPQAEASYSFTYGDAFFIALDNTLDRLDLFFPLGDYQPPLWLWLNERVTSEEARRARWRFAFAHYPPGSNCYPADHEYGLPESAVRDFLLPLLRENGFHAYFAGHMHLYERFDYDGLAVFTTGGGGGNLDDPADCDDQLPQARLQRATHHALLVELDDQRAVIKAIDIDGAELDRLEILP